MKEMKFEIPADCEVDKIETQDGHIVVSFREKERQLPKSWEEFCDMFPDYNGEYLVVPNSDDKIAQVEDNSIHEKRTYRNAELLPDRATAEAVLALCQLIQLRECYNGDWVPDWKDNMQKKFVIHLNGGEIAAFEWHSTAASPLYFKSAELRDEFLRNFRPLIEKLKPLYGIKEGGDK